MDRGVEMGEWEAEEREQAALRTDDEFDALQEQARKSKRAGAPYAARILQFRLSFLQNEIEALASMAFESTAVRERLLAAGEAGLAWLPQAAGAAEEAAAEAAKLTAAAMVAEGRYTDACKALARVAAACRGVGPGLAHAGLELFVEGDATKIEQALAKATAELEPDEVWH
jgi:hypothetical protein